MNNEDGKYFNIQMAAQLSGLSAHTIRAWEKRYQALTPQRSDNGRRQYSNLEVERLGLLSRLTNLGNSIGQIAHLPDTELKAIYLKITQYSEHFFEASSNSEIIKETYSDEVIKNILISLKTYRVNEVSSTLQAIGRDYSTKELALKIIKPLLLQVRELEKNEIFNKAQVQALNSVIKFHSGNIIYSHYEKKFKSKAKIALTTIEEDYETSNLMLATLLCCHHQLNFFYLNSNLPHLSIIEACKSISASTLILSLSYERSLQKNCSMILHSIIDGLPDNVELWGLSQSSELFLDNKLKKIKWYKSLTDLDSALEKLL